MTDIHLVDTQTLLKSLQRDLAQADEHLRAYSRWSHEAQVTVHELLRRSQRPVTALAYWIERRNLTQRGLETAEQNGGYRDVVDIKAELDLINRAIKDLS